MGLLFSWFTGVRWDEAIGGKLFSFNYLLWTNNKVYAIRYVLKEKRIGFQLGPQSLWIDWMDRGAMLSKKKVDVLMFWCLPRCITNFRNAAHIHFYRIPKEEASSRFLPYCLRAGCPSNQSIDALRSQLLEPISLLRFRTWRISTVLNGAGTYLRFF